MCFRHQMCEEHTFSQGNGEAWLILSPDGPQRCLQVDKLILVGEAIKVERDRFGLKRKGIQKSCLICLDAREFVC